jgi:chitinase
MHVFSINRDYHELMLRHLTIGSGILVFCGLFLAAAPVLATAESKEVIAYVFVRDRAIQPGEIDAAKLTRINYAFANIAGGEVVEGFPHDAQNYPFLVNLKSLNKRLQVLASVGGWTWSGGFSDMARTAAGRQKFIASAVRFVKKYNLDGLDIDWEYPGLPGAGNPFRPEDMRNYTALIIELRTAFNAAEKQIGHKLITSVAAGASPEFLAHTEMGKVAPFLDTVNLMSYDYYVPGANKITGHHAPLNVNPADPNVVSVDNSVKAYLAAGVPREELVLGVPFYGHAWSDVADTPAHGLFQAGKAPQIAASIDTSYANIAEVLLKNGYTRYWDAAASAPFLYNPKTQTFVSYEDTQSVSLKAQYVLQQKLRGIMFWEYHSDDNGALLTAIGNVFAAGKN